MAGSPQRFDLTEGAWLDHWPELVADARSWLDRLVAELPLHAEHYTMFGRTVAAPRLVSWHGDPGAAYVYSGLRHEPAPWTPALADLRAVVEEVTGLGFNAVLANYYRDGQDSMGWHSDAEPEVGPRPDDRWIASVSLGAVRRFALRHKRRKREGVTLELASGSLLVMRGTTQTHYRHALPKTAGVAEPRLNLTFRHIVAS